MNEDTNVLDIPDQSMGDSPVDYDEGKDKKVVFSEDLHKEMPMIKGGLNGGNSDPFQGIDMSALVDEDIGDVIQLDEKELDKDRYVLAKYLGSHNNPYTEIKQKINGREAVFPLDKWVITPYYFILSAKKSGYADFVNQPGGRNMKFAPNHPSFQIQEIPDGFNGPDRIFEWQSLLKEKKGVFIPLACEQF